MRLRGQSAQPVQQTDENLIKKILAVDKFKVHSLKIEGDTIQLIVTNTKFRSIAQAIGRLASTLQRFASDDINFAEISFQRRDLITATYSIDLEKITQQQFGTFQPMQSQPAIIAKNPTSKNYIKEARKFSWGLGPYIAHRLFNPELPLSVETGVEFQGTYHFTSALKLSGTLRKSLLTNLTDNTRRSNSVLPRVHSDWPLYDLEGQNGHIHELTLSYTRNLAPGLYGTAHAGLIEPFFAGVGGELLIKPANWPIALGLDIHRARKRDYDMRFNLRDYTTTVGHLSLYYDAGNMFDVEVNAGRYLAGDWGSTLTVSRKFGSGWEVGGYATITDVPFDTFGEGSFDKAIYVSVPIDWIISSPTRSKRRLTLRPITRDGGANLASARKLYRYIEGSQNSQLKREFGRLWR